MAVGPAVGGGDGCNAAEGREGCLRAQAVRVAAGGHQQGRGVGADTERSTQAGVVLGGGSVQGSGESVVFRAEGLNSAGEALQSRQESDARPIARGTESGDRVDLRLAAQSSVLDPDVIRSGDEDVRDLVQRGGAGLDGEPCGVVEGAYPADRVVLGV